jgi:gliding motility-associated-like protein
LANLPGTYTVSVFDVSTPTPYCLGVVQVEVPNAILPEITIQATDLTCAGAGDGSIQIAPIDNGNLPVTYSLIPNLGTFDIASNSFVDLPSGTYSVLATGANTCSTQIDGIVIGEPLPIGLPAPLVTPFSCVSGNTPSNASITINPSTITGGSGNYVRFDFINTQGTADLTDDVIEQSGASSVFVTTNTAGGSYLIRVYDSNNCAGTVTALISGYESLLGINAHVSNALSCLPGNDGEITVSATTTGNTAALEYSKDGGLSWQNSPVFSGLDAGIYNLAVRNINSGCSIETVQELVVPEPFDLAVSVLQDQSCYGTDSGMVLFELQDSSYVGGFDWAIYQTNGTPGDPSDDSLVISANSTDNSPTPAINIAAGAYRLVVSQTQLPGCTQERQFEIFGPEAPISGAVALTPISCIGNDGVLELYNVEGGSGSYFYYVGTTPPIDLADFVNSPRFENLTPGTYEAWILDGYGCQTQIADQLTLSDPVPITAQLQINQENCTEFEGALEVVGVMGGMGSNYNYQLIRDGLPIGIPQASPLFSGLGSGTYEVRITDPMGCETVVGPQTFYAELHVVAAIVSALRCDVPDGGEIALTVQGGSANLEFNATYPDGTSVTNNSGNFSGLSLSGDYTFMVTDLDTNSTCVETLTVSLAAPSAVVLEMPEVVNVLCYGNSDGVITVQLTQMQNGINDNPPHEYSLFNQGTLVAGPQSSAVFTGLQAGNYTVEVRSSAGCIAQQNAEVSEPNPLGLGLAFTPFSCDSGNIASTGTLVASVPNGAGTAPYLYSLNGVNYQSSNVFEILDSGSVQTITVFVKDQQGCIVSENITLQPLNRFVPTVTYLSELNCANPGQLQVTVNDNGNPLNTYLFELMPLGNPNGSLLSAPIGNTAVFEVTAPGNYVFRVTDSTTGCWELTAPFEIAPFDLLAAQAQVISSEVCFGDLQGTISLALLNYTGAFNYEVYDSNGITTGISGTSNTGNPISISGLGGGAYYVEVTEVDMPFCTALSNTVIIDAPEAPLSALFSQVAAVTCTDNQGVIQALPEGGYAPYTFVLTHSGTNQTYEQVASGPVFFSQLSAGDYAVTIIDYAGCVFEDVITLDLPNPVVATAEASPSVLACYGDINGVVTATQVAGGSGSYQYQLHVYDPTGTSIVTSTGFQSSPVFTGLGAGIYSISVTDGWNCDLETNQVSISEPSEVSGTLVQSAQLTCAEDATITLTAFGGTAPYQYSADGIVFYPMSGGDSHVLNVIPGTYQYYVRDAFGCGTQMTNQVVVEPVEPLYLEISTDAAVVNCSGEATASLAAYATGGLGNYLFTLYADPGLTTVLSGPQETGTFNELSAGTYYIQVSSMDCETTSQALVIDEPAPLIVVREEALSVTCSGEADGVISVEVSGGAGNIQYAISPNLNQFDTTNTFTGLAPGFYQVLAQDQNGCFLLFDFEIAEPEPIEAIAVTTPEVCAESADGMIELEITGGQAPYWTALDSNQPGAYVQHQTLFTDVTAGTHVVFVRDSRGCETNIFVTIDPGVNLNANVTPIYACTGAVPDNYLEVLLEDQSISDEVMYALDTTDPAYMQLEPNFTNIAPGQHYLTVFHVNGCYKTVPFEIAAIEGLTLTLAEGNINQLVATVSGGSPAYRFWLNDQDMGTTNAYYISESGTYSVRVMDQNGCVAEAQIYLQYIEIELPDHFSPGGEVLDAHWKPKNTEAYPNILIKIYDRYGRVVADLSGAVEGWDGTYKGKPLPTGDYWYVIRLNGELDDREFFGHFTLYR